MRCPSLRYASLRARTRGALLSGLAAAALLPFASGVHACGYHSSQTLALGMLNWSFPNALYVRTAVWQAEDAGLLPPRDTVKSRDLFAFQRTASDLRSFGSRVSAASGDNGGPISLAVVLIDSVLWTRFAAEPSGYAAHVHVDGPKSADIVIVTDAKVIRALVDGSLDAAKAETHGLLRLYRRPELHDRVRRVLTGISTAGAAETETLGVAATERGEQ